MAIRYPLKRFQGPFEKYVLVTGGRGASRFVSQCLESFFGHWPTILGLEQFTVVDIHEYASWRESQGCGKGRITMELQQVSRFYQWCIRNKNCRIYDPVKPWLQGRERRPRPAYTTVSIDEFIRLMNASGVAMQRYLITLVEGRPVRDIIPPARAGFLFKQIAKSVGRPDLDLKKLRTALRKGLWREIIRRHCMIWRKQYLDLHLYNPLAQEAKVLRTLPTNVETATTNEGSPVINSSDDCFSVGWVGNFQDSSEPEVGTGDSHEATMEDCSVSG